MSASRPIRIGILVPSSNTALEPLTMRILSSVSTEYTTIAPTVHFSRFRVTTIGLSAAALSQFDLYTMLEAAQLLADARVDVIGWSGTSAGWLGFETDEKLCSAIEEKTGIKTTSSTLALNKALAKLSVRRLGLVTPYTEDVQNSIVRNYAEIGIKISTERHLSRTDNVNFASIGNETFGPMIKGIIKEGNVQAVTTFCTNLNAAGLVERWEEEYAIPVLDTVTTVVWDCLSICGINTSNIKGWGKIMDL